MASQIGGFWPGHNGESPLTHALTLPVHVIDLGHSTLHRFRVIIEH